MNFDRSSTACLFPRLSFQHHEMTLDFIYQKSSTYFLLFIYFFFLKFLWSPFIHHPTLIRMFFPSYISSTHREMVGFQNCWMGVFIPCSFILKLEPWIAADYTVFLHKKVGRKRSSHANERTEWNKHADAHRTHTQKKNKYQELCPE